jgi:hypothetical protein
MPRDCDAAETSKEDLYLSIFSLGSPHQTTLTMPPALPPTNMTAEEVIPDIVNPNHDSRFWCLPPVRDTPSQNRTNRFPMYLVSQGKSVGIWHNWSVVCSRRRNERN